VAVRIKLKRLGKIRTPMYRIVIADQRAARNSRSIEEVGVYQPKENPSVIEVNSERVQYWLSVGAQPTDPVKAILKLTGDWQKYTGEGDTSNKVQVAAVKDAFKVKEEEAKNPPKPKETPKVEEPKAEESATEEVAAEAPVAEEVKTEETTQETQEETKAEEAPAAEVSAAEETKEA
jgi:small subunit ribosomal protein S16